MKNLLLAIHLSPFLSYLVLGFQLSGPLDCSIQLPVRQSLLALPSIGTNTTLQAVLTLSTSFKIQITLDPLKTSASILHYLLTPSVPPPIVLGTTV